MRDIYTNHLIKLKESQKISFSALQDKTGITSSTLCRWFKGEGNPTVDELETIFTALGGDIRDVFADVGEQELRASRKIDYMGADALLADFERREKIYKDNCDARIAHQIELREKLQESFHTAIASLEKTHADALKKRDETYSSSVGYLKEDLRVIREKNRELMNQALEAEKRADIAQEQRADIDERRHDVFYAMLRLCIILSISFFIAGICIAPPWMW